MDFVSEEAEIAGRNAAEYALGGSARGERISVTNGANVSYVCPQYLDKGAEGNVKLFFRVTGTFKNCTIKAKCGDRVLVRKKKKIAVPGEMENLLLPQEKFGEINGEISVSLEVEND